MRDVKRMKTATSRRSLYDDPDATPGGEVLPTGSEEDGFGEGDARILDPSVAGEPCEGRCAAQPSVPARPILKGCPFHDTRIFPVVVRWMLGKLTIRMELPWWGC